MAPSAIFPSPPLASNGNEPALPIISLAPLLDSNPSCAHSAALSLLSALKTSGFLYLIDSPVPPDLLSRIYESSARFFARPLAEKESLAWKTPRANRGYSRQGHEKVSLGMSKIEVQHDRGAAGGEDQKESFEIGREGEGGCPNRWPEDDEEFQDVMQDFFERCRQLHAVVMKGIAIGLGLGVEFFADYVKQGDNTLRLLHYPGVPAHAFANGRVRAGLHSDYGSVTLLFQDSRGISASSESRQAPIHRSEQDYDYTNIADSEVPGGLQVERENGKFVDVTPIEGTIVLNAGDLLSRWSNAVIPSTRHRVVEPPLKVGAAQDGYPPRYSVAYFCNPDFDKTIEALPGTYGGKQGPRRWEPINSGEYLVQRLAATY